MTALSLSLSLYLEFCLNAYLLQKLSLGLKVINIIAKI